MSRSELSEGQGVITYLYNTTAIGQFMLAVRDNEGRVLSITYNCGNEDTAKSICESLRKGMMIKFYVEGQISPTQAAYHGIGIITIISDGEDK